MGYTTEFIGRVQITPPLSTDEITYLRGYAATRHIQREEGPYHVGDDGTPINGVQHPGEPGYWCQWTPTEDGAWLEWTGHEKFSAAGEWMAYVIHHFIGPQPHAPMPFIRPHRIDGVIRAYGDAEEDNWILIVEDSRVYTVDGYDPRAVRQELTTAP